MKALARYPLLLGAIVALLSACHKAPPPPHKPAPEVTVVTAHAESVPLRSEEHTSELQSH